VSPSKRTTEEESLAVETSVALAAAEEATRVAEEERSREAARASAAAARVETERERADATTKALTDARDEEEKTRVRIEEAVAKARAEVAEAAAKAKRETESAERRAKEMEEKLLAAAVRASSFLTLVPIRPRRRGERRSLRTFAGVSLRPGSLAFNTRPRRLSTPFLTPFNSTPTGDGGEIGGGERETRGAEGEEDRARGDRAR
jgi:hypothetical protein